MKALRVRLESKDRGFRALIEDKATYEGVKNGTLTWKHQEKITHFIVPADVFARLVAIDRELDKAKKANEDEGATS